MNSSDKQKYYIHELAYKNIWLCELVNVLKGLSANLGCLIGM
jgi:hypothetical protein